MICRPCRTAGDLNKINEPLEAALHHSNCEFPQSCTCQHRVEREHVAREERKESGESTTGTASLAD